MKKIFRKIHLWLSVPFGIFITLICFSGAMLVFEKEITEICRHNIYFVEDVKEKPLPIDSLIEKICATLPDSVTVTGVTVSPDAERTWQVSLSKPRRASLYVNPYTGEVAGRNERLSFYDTMFRMHRWMMGSSNGLGKLLVGVSTLMLVIILITGILMWLTNRKKPLRRSLIISFTKGWPRFWHDLHVAGGIYATLFLLAFALTGLTWSFSWYRTGFYCLFGVESSAEGYRGHGGNRTTDSELTHNRNSRIERRRDKSDRVQAERNITNAESTENRIGRHHQSGEVERNFRPVGEKPEQESKFVQSGQENNGQPAEERAERIYENKENTEHRGHHGRRSKYHEGDSAGRYSRHYHTDSLRTRSDEQEIAIVGNTPNDSEHHSDTVLKDQYRRRRGRVGQRSNEKKELPRRSRPIKSESALSDVTSVMIDSVVTVEQPQMSPFIHWQKVYETLAKSYPDYRQITLSNGSASVVPAGRSSLRAGDRFDFDIQNGKIIGSTPYSEQPKSTHVRSAVYTVHVGTWGGLLTRIITFFAALLGASLPLTGYYLWIRRLYGKSKHHQHPGV